MMNTLFEITAETPSGIIKVGDVIMVEYGPYTSIAKTKEVDGCVGVDHFMHGPDTKLSSLLSVSYCHIKKISPKECYLFCKKNQWKTSEYLSLYKNQ